MQKNPVIKEIRLVGLKGYTSEIRFEKQKLIVVSW